MAEPKPVGPSLSECLADFSVALCLDDLPDMVVDYAKLLLMDLIGAALAGSNTEEAVACMEAVTLLGGPGGRSTLWGIGKKTGPAHAALYNGIAASAREIDDFGGVDHSGAVVIPAIIAMGEAHPPLSGKRLILSMVAGYEIGRRVLEAAGGYRAHNNHAGWHSTGTCGSFAAAAAAAKALALDVKQTAWALGLSGSFTGGTWAFSKDGAMSKRYHPGRAAETGVVAAAMARAGFTGPIFVFESDWGGFFNTYAKGTALPHLLTDGLGSKYRILNSGIKPYASCRDTHSAIDAVLAARKENGLTPGDIEEIEIRCRPETLQMVGSRKFPSTRLEAQLSLSYSVAVALIKGCASLTQFAPSALNNQETKSLFARIRYVTSTDLALDSEPIVKICAHDGRVIEKQVPFARGAPQNPMPRRNVEEKFHSCAAQVLSESTIVELRHRIDALETVKNICEITRLLSCEKKKSKPF